MPLCNTFRREAGRVWRQMYEAQKLGLSLGEETITETCLFNIARSHKAGKLTIVPATKPQEAIHGAAITKASRATATRDLQDLVARGALTRTGERRHTRYFLNLPDRFEEAH